MAVRAQSRASVYDPSLISVAAIRTETIEQPMVTDLTVLLINPLRVRVRTR